MKYNSDQSRTKPSSCSAHPVASGAMDALRRDFMSEGMPISVTSVKPQGPPPIYSAAVIADCVLYAAVHPVRDLSRGGAAKMMAVSQMVSPKLMDILLGDTTIPPQRTMESTPPGMAGNLDAARDQ